MSVTSEDFSPLLIPPRDTSATASYGTTDQDRSNIRTCRRQGIAVTHAHAAISARFCRVPVVRLSWPRGSQIPEACDSRLGR